MNKLPSFEVSREGLKQLQAGREPWMLAKELVSNSFDEESVNLVIVHLNHGSRVTFTVEDNGAGFRDLRDAYTLYGWTPKREDVNVRGRFNLGEKEIVATAVKARIDTVGGWVEWDSDGQRIQGDEGRQRGTLVSLTLDWSPDQVAEAVKKLEQLIPPKDKTYWVNDKKIPHRKPVKRFTVPLATVLLKGQQLAPTVRKTKVHIYKVLDGETPSLLEMGIPVQDIDPPFHIDVQQKIPLSPHRNAVTPGYLQDVYAEALNVMVSFMSEDEAAASWVDKAMADKRCTDKAVAIVGMTRYPKTVFWSPDSTANERARDKGFAVLHARGIDKAVLARLKATGMETTHERFGVDWAADGEEGKPTFETVDKTPEMRQMERFIQSLGIELIDIAPDVVYQRIVNADPNLDWCASWGNRTLKFYVNHLSKNFFDSLGAEQIGIILHEFAHHGHSDEPHDKAYRERLEELAGKVAIAALEFPDLFNYGWYRDRDD